ncbi:MAG: hypothetical protein KDA65_10185 [Planctomycetaceae bacterium]|nr:hypothetical protein [Planctomycetaceae bacterium]
MTWQLVDRYGDNARFMLFKKVFTRGEITEQLMAHKDILSPQGLMRLTSFLYYGPSKNNFKSGVGAVAPFVIRPLSLKGPKQHYASVYAGVISNRFSYIEVSQIFGFMTTQSELKLTELPKENSLEKASGKKRSNQTYRQVGCCY